MDAKQTGDNRSQISKYIIAGIFSILICTFVILVHILNGDWKQASRIFCGVIGNGSKLLLFNTTE